MFPIMLETPYTRRPFTFSIRKFKCLLFLDVTGPWAFIQTQYRRLAG